VVLETLVKTIICVIITFSRYPNIYCKLRNLPRCTQLQYRFAVISEVPSSMIILNDIENLVD